jgi:hypothetical protein
MRAKVPQRLSASHPLAGYFPSEQVAMKPLSEVEVVDPEGTGQQRWMNRRKPAARSAFAITFEGRLF